MNSKNIFLLDAVGALLSLILTALILPSLSPLIGIPQNILYCLAVFPLIYSLYSFTCYKLQTRKSWMILGIVLGNSLYAIISGTLLLTYDGIKLWGYLFLSAEIVVLIGVIALELMVYLKVRKQLNRAEISPRPL